LQYVPPASNSVRPLLYPPVVLKKVTLRVSAQCEKEGIELIPDEDDEETWEDLLEDEEIVWDPNCKPLEDLNADPYILTGQHPSLTASRL